MKKQVYILNIKEVSEHPNADNLEVVSFNYGHKSCVVPKGKFVKGQKVIRILPEVYLAKKTTSADGLRFDWLEGFYGDCVRDDKHYITRRSQVRMKNIRGVDSYGIVLALSDVRDNIGENLRKKYHKKVNKHFFDNSEKNYTLLCQCLGVAEDSYDRDIIDGTIKPLGRILRPMVSKKFPPLKVYDENGKRIYERESRKWLCPISLAETFAKRALGIKNLFKENEEKYKEENL